MASRQVPIRLLSCRHKYPNQYKFLFTETVLIGSMAGVSSTMIGAVQGITAGDRNFPPQAGITFVAWICVERFSSLCDPHPIRLLTISCKTKQTNGSYRDTTCLTIRISGMDKSLVVSRYSSEGMGWDRMRWDGTIWDVMECDEMGSDEIG